MGGGSNILFGIALSRWWKFCQNMSFVVQMVEVLSNDDLFSITLCRWERFAKMLLCYRYHITVQVGKSQNAFKTIIFQIHNNCNLHNSKCFLMIVKSSPGLLLAPEVRHLLQLGTSLMRADGQDDVSSKKLMA